MPIAVIEIALEPSIVSDFVAGRLDQDTSSSIARVVRHDAGLACAISQACNVRKRVHQRLARRTRTQSITAAESGWRRSLAQLILGVSAVLCRSGRFRRKPDRVADTLRGVLRRHFSPQAALNGKLYYR